MNLKYNLENLYLALRGNKKLLRLLHYFPKNAIDDPLDVNKLDVDDLPKSHDLIDKILVPSDKSNDLIQSKICRLCVYTGTRQLKDFYSPSSRSLQDNVYTGDQVYIFDVYVHLEIDKKDFRMMWICDTINEILFNEQITDVGKFRFSFGSPIMNTPDGYVGYKLAYITPSIQEPYGADK